jgi:hypothetical protein
LALVELGQYRSLDPFPTSLNVQIGFDPIGSRTGQGTNKLTSPTVAVSQSQGQSRAYQPQVSTKGPSVDPAVFLFD